MTSKRILITGASGFIGSFIVEEAVRLGMDVWAAVREGSSMRYLTDERIHIVKLNLDSTEQMKSALSSVPSIDYAVHAAGLTKAMSSDDFYHTNTDGTAHLCTALQEVHPTIKRFVFISSLSVMGPVRETLPHEDILPSDTPQPNTHYAKSKLLAEEWIEKHCQLPFTILRPTGVYGPREKDYMLMVENIRRGIDIIAGYDRQDLTFIYVKDLVQAVFASMKSTKTTGKSYFLASEGIYTPKEFSDIIIQVIGKRHIMRFTVPLWVLRIVCHVGDFWMHITQKPITLNNDHYNVLRQRNWRCDTSDAVSDFGFSPQYSLQRGVEEMLSKQSLRKLNNEK